MWYVRGMRVAITIILALLALAPAADATQQLWIVNRSTAGAHIQGVIRMAADGTGTPSYGPDLGSSALSLTGLGDSLYVGTSSGIVRTDFDGVAIESKGVCSSPSALAAAPGSLYVACGEFPGGRIVRVALAADGSMGAATTFVSLSSGPRSMTLANGYLYVVEDYPTQVGITRVPVANPAAMQEPWYSTATLGAATVGGSYLYLSTNEVNSPHLYRTSLEAPAGGTLTAVAPPATGAISGLLASGQTLFISSYNQDGSTQSFVRTQSILTPTAPAQIANWGAVNQPQPGALYAGDQTQTWSVDESDRSLANGAFAQPFTASSGLAPAITSTTPTICAVSGASIVPLAAGTCSLTATQAGNVAFLAAPAGSASIRILAAATTTTSKATVARAKVIGTSIVTSITVPVPGAIRTTGTVAGLRKSKTTTVCSTKATARKAGSVLLTCRLNKIGLERRRRGAFTVTLTTTYTPTGGTKQTTTQRVKVARSARR